MNLHLPSAVARVACLLVFAFVTGFGLMGCADSYATAPVYRGAYYAYDVYPYGYQGYPGYPYYGAPFGNRASTVTAERSANEQRPREGATRRAQRRSHRSRRAAEQQTSHVEQR